MSLIYLCTKHTKHKYLRYKFNTGLEPSWRTIWSNSNNTSKNHAHGLIYFKMIHRAYAAPIKCFKMKIITSPNCNHCQDQAPGTTVRMFWECSVISNFWTHVLSVLSELLGSTISPDPRLCLLNDDSSLSLNLKQQRLLFAGLTATVTVSLYFIKKIVDHKKRHKYNG